MSVAKFETGKVYTFNTLMPALLGAQFINVKVEGEITYNVAKKYPGFNPDVKHANLIAHLPAGTPTSAANLTYIIVRGENGSETVLAVEWLDKNTATLVNSITATWVAEGVTTQQIQIINQTFALLGLSPVLNTQ